jgi:hypothetical protein
LTPTTDTLEPIEPLSVAPVPLSVGIEGADDGEPSPAPPMPAAGSIVGHPIAELYGLANRLASKRLFPDDPLDESEIDELIAACAAVEDMYAPDLQGAGWVWARLLAVTSAVYVPRVMRKREQAKHQVVDDQVVDDQVVDDLSEAPEQPPEKEEDAEPRGLGL